MQPDLALSAVEYAIQLAQHIKRTIKAYHENPPQYENLISRFRTVCKSLRIITESNSVDYQSPIWGAAFRRIRDEFENASSMLKEIHHAIRSSPMQRLFHAKETSQKLNHLEHKIHALQKDLDLLGFFTSSNNANASQTEILIHNVQDVKASLLSLEARLQSMERKLLAHTCNNGDGDRYLPSGESPMKPDSALEAFEEGVVEYEDIIKGLYQREFENPRQYGGIVASIASLQARLQKYAAAVIETHPSEPKSALLSETCERLLNQWNLHQADIHFLPENLRYRNDRSVIYEGSMTLRGLWQYPIREASVAAKVVLDVEEEGRLDAILRRVAALREISHPNIVSFYGACFPNGEDFRKSREYQKKWSTRYTLLITELMTHNLSEAINLPAVCDTDTKLMILANVSRGVEYLHRRGVFRIALSTKHVMLRIRHREVIGEAKLSSLWSSREDKRNDEELLYKEKGFSQSRVPIYHQDTFNFGILMCFVLSTKVDHSSWDDGVFTQTGSPNDMESVLGWARVWVRGIEPPFLKKLAKRCLVNDKVSPPSFRFIRKCIEAFLKNKPLPDLSTPDCGEEMRQKGKNIFYGKYKQAACPEKAVPYFEKAVSCGNVAALVNLGNCHFYGLGTQRDVKLGFELFRAAAFAGNAAGLVKLGIFFHSGIPGASCTDILFAVEMYRRAAIQGDASAQFKLGCYKYNEEEGNPRHLEEAAALWHLAASGGHRFAQFFIGRCFEEGSGVQRDVAAARIWYARSAVQGHLGAKWAVQRLSEPSTVKSTPPKQRRTAEKMT